MPPDGSFTVDLEAARLSLGRRRNDCVPESLSEITGLAADVFPVPEGGSDWLDWECKYNLALAAARAPVRITLRRPPRWRRRRWIAVVSTGEHHAVVMKGNRVMWDPDNVLVGQRMDATRWIQVAAASS